MDVLELALMPPCLRQLVHRTHLAPLLRTVPSQLLPVHGFNNSDESLALPPLGHVTVAVPVHPDTQLLYHSTRAKEIFKMVVIALFGPRNHRCRGHPRTGWSPETRRQRG